MAEKKVSDNTVKKVEKIDKVEKTSEKSEKKEFFASKSNRKRSKVGKIINVTLWVILIAWMGICVIDFVRAKIEKEPIFTVSKKTTYVDGDVTKYTGLGYRIYFYNRDSYKGVNFGPMWSKDKSEK